MISITIDSIKNMKRKHTDMDKEKYGMVPSVNLVEEKVNNIENDRKTQSERSTRFHHVSEQQRTWIHNKLNTEEIKIHSLPQSSSSDLNENAKHQIVEVLTSDGRKFKFNRGTGWLKGINNSKYFNFNLDRVAERKCEMYQPLTFDEQFDSDKLMALTVHDDNEQGETVLVQAGTGMGKTSIGIKSVIDQHTNKGNSIVVITENCALANFIKGKFSNFHHYLDCMMDEGTYLEHQSHVIIQMESLHKLKDKVYDVIILDEITSFLLHPISTTVLEHRRLTDTVEVLFRQFEKSPFLYGFDADIMGSLLHK